MKYLSILFILSLFALNANSQWQQDQRLTNNPGASYLSDCHARCIAANGSYIHIVWWNLQDGNWEIFYKRSTDNGINWGTDTRLTNDTAISDYPSVSASGSFVHVVWRDMRDGNTEIYYKRSTDGGTNWGPDERLTSNSTFSTSPSVISSVSEVHVVWNDFRDGNFEIYYKHSTDGGTSWDTDTRLTNNAATSMLSCVSVSGAIVHVVWQDERNGEFEVYYKRSTDGGSSWGTDVLLTNDSIESYYPTVSVFGSVVHVVWVDKRDANFEVYYKRSTNAGMSWEQDVRLTNNQDYSRLPSIAVSGANLHVVWRDGRDGNNEIYYKCSTDGGTNWQPDVRLTNNFSDSEHSFVSVSGSVVHVIWYDYRDGNYEIYYNQNPTGNPIGIININSEIPNNFSLSQNYPNPFNPATKIKFALPKRSFVSMAIYDELGREVDALVNEMLNAGTYEVVWNSEKFSSGVYFSKFIASDYSSTRKMVIIK